MEIDKREINEGVEMEPRWIVEDDEDEAKDEQ